MTYVPLDVSGPVWDRFFWVAPLVVIGTREPDGTFDLAPKHMATPMGWKNYYGFVCTPRHATYGNAEREGAFSVSFPGPDQLVHASLAAEPRCDDGHKAVLTDLPVAAGEALGMPLLEDAYVQLECELDRIVEGFGENGLIIGKVAAARVRADCLRETDRDDAALIAESPLLAYLSPGQFARIDRGHNFPFPAGFSR